MIKVKYVFVYINLFNVMMNYLDKNLNIFLKLWSLNYLSYVIKKQL